MRDHGRYRFVLTEFQVEKNKSERNFDGSFGQDLTDLAYKHSA